MHWFNLKSKMISVPWNIASVLMVICTLIAITLVAEAGYAQSTKQQGVGQIKYSGWGGPSSNVKDEAVQKAKLSAIEKYTAGFTTSKMMSYEKIRTTIEGNLDRYITEYKILADETDKDAKRYSVVIDASINVALIEVELQKVSAIESVSADEKSYLSFVFVAREVSSRKAFDARRTERTVEESLSEEAEVAHADGASAGITSEIRTDRIRTTGGLTLQKSDEVEYDVSSAQDINAAMTNIFTSAGYEVIEADYLQEESNGLVNVENFIADFRYGDDISGDTRRDAAKGCRELGVQFFAIGTMDVGAKDIDSVSGLYRVYVSVNGKIMDLKGRFPKTVASIGPVQFAGLGPEQSVARRNALRQAGESAAKDLVSQLRAKDIK
jgi:hypothetical protein